MATIKLVKSIYTGSDVTALGELATGDTVNLPDGSQLNSQNILTSADVGSTVQAYDATLLNDADIGVSVQAYDATLLNDADIGVSVQPYDATIVVDADIGVTVQAYDADTAKYDDTTANFTGTLQNGGSNVVVDSDIGVSVQAYDDNLSSFISAFTLPTVDGTENQLLQTDGAGNLTFSTASGGVTTGKSIAMAMIFGF